MVDVLNQEGKDPREELVGDLIKIVSIFAGKLYDMRSHMHKEVVEGAGKLVEHP